MHAVLDCTVFRHYLTGCVQGYPNCVLTPNIAELGRLAKAVGVTLDGPMGVSWQKHVPDIAKGEEQRSLREWYVIAWMAAKASP